MNKRSDLSEFRIVLNSYTNLLNSLRNNIKHLLGKSQNYWSGIYRESLIKDVLRKFVPQGVAIDTGFIYGYDKKKNSDQLDIIIWNSSKHSPVYKTNDFVVLSAESVISVISVKSRLVTKEIEDGLSNLESIIPLDMELRDNFRSYYPKDQSCMPISKYLLFINEKNVTKENKRKYCESISEHFKTLFKNNNSYSEYLVNILNEMNPSGYSEKDNELRDKVRIFYPRLIASITTTNFSLYTGFGENEDNSAKQNWIPTLYSQKSEITKPFEKFIFYLMQDIYRALGTSGIPFLSALGDIDPRIGYDNRDISEIDTQNRYSLF